MKQFNETQDDEEDDACGRECGSPTKSGQEGQERARRGQKSRFGILALPGMGGMKESDMEAAAGNDAEYGMDSCVVLTGDRRNRSFSLKRPRPCISGSAFGSRTEVRVAQAYPSNCTRRGRCCLWGELVIPLSASGAFGPLAVLLGRFCCPFIALTYNSRQ